MDFKMMEEAYKAAKYRIRFPSLWCQGSLGWPGGPTCMEGAFEDWIMLNIPYCAKRDCFNELSGLMCKLLDWPEHELYVWNDVAGRTHKEVMAAFDMAIAYCQVQQEKQQTVELQHETEKV